MAFLSVFRTRDRYARREALARALGVAAMVLGLGMVEGAGSWRTGNPDYLIEHWSASDGLPENSALGVAQTPDGYLWVGSQNGLMRFNGRSFRAAEQFFGCPALGSVVAAVRVDGSGRLWAGTTAGVWTCQQGTWRNVGPADLDLRSLAEEKTGKVFVGTSDGRAYVYDGRSLDRLELPREVTASGVFCCRDSVDGGIWLVNRGFVGRWTGRGWERQGPEASIPKSVVGASAREGGVWVYGPGWLKRYRAGAAPQSFVVPDLNDPRQILEDRRGRIWLASNARGLARLGLDGASEFITETNGLRHTSSWCVMEDREGNLWLGTSLGGLYRLRDRQFKTVDFEDGLPDRVTRALAVEGPGRILVGTHGGGTAQIEGLRVTRGLGESDGLHVRSLLRDRVGRVWLGALEGLWLRSGGREQRIALPGAFGTQVRSLLEDSAGRIWVGTHGGIGVMEGETCRPWREASALGGAPAGILAEELQPGALWVGTPTAGLFRFTSTNVTHFGPAEGLPGSRICSLTFDPDGCLWVGVFGKGLVQIRGGRITGRVGEEEGLSARTVGSMLTDEAGCYWLGTERGIVRIAAASLHQAAEGRGARCKFDLFNEADGMHSAECADGCYPAAVRDEAGRMWFATASGVVTVDPRAVQPNTNAPPLVIERVTYRDREGTRRQVDSPRGKLQLPPGNREIEVQVAALTYTAPGRLRFSFQIEGVDPSWLHLGNRREIYFQTLAHGEYPLRVRASSYGGGQGESELFLRLTVPPLFWQTMWFRGLVLLAAVGGVSGGVWRVQRQKLLRQQKQMERERILAHEQARLASVLEGTSDFVGFFSLAGTLFYVNPAGRALAGLGEEDISRLHIRELYSAETALFIEREALPQAARQRTWSGETELLRRDGRRVPVSQVIVAHRDATDQLVFHSTILRDISGPRVAQDALQKSEGALRAFMDALPTPALLLDRSGTLLVANAAAQRSLGGTGLAGRNARELPGARQGKWLAQAEGVFATGKPVQFEESREGQDYLTYLSPVLDGKSAVSSVAMYSLDLTERRKLEEQLRQSQKMEAIGQLCGGVAHDFNNILTVVQGHVSLLMARSDAPPEVRESLSEIGRAGERAIQLTQQLLAFSRRQVMRPRLLDLNEVVTGIVKMLQRLLGEDIRMQLHLHGQPLLMQADAGMLDQVLMNLAVNARDAMPDGGQLILETGARVLTEAEARDTTAGRYYCLTVTDTGCGMSDEVKAHVFEPFFTTKAVGKGTGLGLATVFGIVRQHRGAIRVESEVGRGTTFHILFPALEINRPAAIPETTPPPIRGGTETVLLVEDDRALRRLAAVVLAQHGYQVLEAANGPEALRVADTQIQRIDLLLTDVVMPEGMSGRQLATRLQTLKPGLKVIFMSGYSAELAGREIILREGQNFMQKPVSSRQVLETVRRCLDQAG